MLVLLDGADDRVVEFVAADADGVGNDEAAERGDRDLACASADVDDQGTDRLADREAAGPNRGRERLVDQRGVRGAGSERSCSTALRSTGVIPLGTHTIAWVRE